MNMVGFTHLGNRSFTGLISLINVAVMSYNIFVTSSYTLGLHHFLTNPTIQYSKLGSILNPKTFWVISLVFILLTDVDLNIYALHS
jgi:hypothetical protein